MGAGFSSCVIDGGTAARTGDTSDGASEIMLNSELTVSIWAFLLIKERAAYGFTHQMFFDPGRRAHGQLTHLEGWSGYPPSSPIDGSAPLFFLVKQEWLTTSLRGKLKQTSSTDWSACST